MLKKVLLVLLFFSCFTSYAHKDTSYAKMYDKTTSIFITGFLYEEINKGYIMGEYANMLAKELGYKDSLLLIFRHDYTRSYPHFMKIVKSNDFISIKYKKSDYSLLETLNLVEYAILTKKTDSLSDDFLKKIESKNPSELVKKVLSKRIYRPDEIEDLDNNSIYSYYAQDNKYYIFRNSAENKPIIVLDNIYLFYTLQNSSFIIFDSQLSFYYSSSFKDNLQQNFVPGSESYYRPFVLNRLSWNIIAFTHVRDERVLLYFIDKNKLQLIEE